MPWSRLSQLCLCAFLISGLTACDSSDDEGSGNADFPGDSAMLGMWESLDETTGQPWDDEYEAFIEISYSASTGVTSLREWEDNSEEGGGCWTLDTITIPDVTPTTITLGAEEGTYRYTADQNRLAFYDGAQTNPDVLFRRSTRTPSSFTPEC